MDSREKAEKSDAVDQSKRPRNGYRDVSRSRENNRDLLHTADLELTPQLGLCLGWLRCSIIST